MKSWILILCLVIGINKSYSQAGMLDSTFGINGIGDISFKTADIGDMGIQKDGKIVLSGVAQGISGFILARYKTNGAIDSSFGTKGKIITPIGDGNGLSYALTLQADGKILAAGQCPYNGIGSNYAIARYNTNGSLDTSFNHGGKFILALLSLDNYGESITVQQDGKILMSGMTNGNLYYFGTIRLNANGSLDNAFGTGGIVKTAFNNPFSYGTCIKEQTDGKIVVGGYSYRDNIHSAFSLVRYNTNGTLDNAFGTFGKLSLYLTDTSDTSDSDESSAIALQEDGKIVMTGYSYSHTNKSYYIPLVRFNTNGLPDNSFGKAGISLTKIRGFNYQRANALTIQPDGKILVTGGGNNSTNSLFDSIFLARYNSDGSFDNGFGDSGVIVISVDSLEDDGNSIALQEDGKIIVAGGSYKYGMTVLRFLSGLNTGVLSFSSPQNSLLIYPNPINTQATLQYTLTQNESISLSLYDMQGRQVQTFFTNQPRTQGEHKDELELASTLAAGNYILSISNGHSSQGVKITVVR